MELNIRGHNVRSIHERTLPAPLKADTHEGACSRNKFAPGACSLIFNQFDSMEQNPRAKILLRNNFFA